MVPEPPPGPDTDPPRFPASERPPERGVDVLRRSALAFGFGVVALSILLLLITIYWQLGREIIWASALAVLFYPLHERILRLVGNRSGLAASLSSILAVLILFVPALLIIFNLATEVRGLWPALRDALGPAAFERMSTWLDASPFRSITRFLLGVEADTGPAMIEAKLQQAAVGVQAFLLDRLQEITKSLPAAVLSFGITLVTFFFFLRYGRSWLEAVQGVLPIETEHSRGLIAIAGRTVNAVFRGVILTAAAQALLAGIGFWVAGAHAPILLGIATFIGSLIPFVGAVAVWLPTCVILYLSGHPWAALGLAAYGTLVISLVDNFMKPILIGREMKLPMLWLFLAIIGGLKLFGFLGVIVGPASLALALACYRIYTEGRKAPV